MKDSLQLTPPAGVGDKAPGVNVFKSLAEPVEAVILYTLLMYSVVKSDGLVTDTLNPVTGTSQFKEDDGDIEADNTGVNDANVNCKAPPVIAVDLTGNVIPFSSYPVMLLVEPLEENIRGEGLEGLVSPQYTDDPLDISVWPTDPN